MKGEGVIQEKAEEDYDTTSEVVSGDMTSVGMEEKWERKERGRGGG